MFNNQHEWKLNQASKGKKNVPQGSLCVCLIIDGNKIFISPISCQTSAIQKED
jgi:hypothetical protein